MRMVSMFVCQAIATCCLALMHCAISCKDTVYVGTSNGQVAKSNDGGDTWTTVLKGVDFIFDIKAKNSNVYAATPNGLYVSHNSGASWSIKNLQNGSHCESHVLSVFVDEEKRVYCLVGYSQGCGRVLISSNNGDTWPTDVPLPGSPFENVPTNMYVDGQRIYVTTSHRLSYTDDVGKTWTSRNPSSGFGPNWVTCVTAKGRAIYLGLVEEDGPVSMSTDEGLTWKTTHAGPTTYGSVSLLYLHNDTLYVALGSDGLSWSNDLKNWTRKTTVDGLTGNYTSSIVVSGENLYLGTYDGLSISRDNGQTWITKTTKDGLPSDLISSVFAQCI